MSLKTRYKILFVGVMILGKKTAFGNLQEAISRMDDVEPTWLSIELEPHEWIARIPVVWNSHSLRIGLAARSRVRDIEKSGKQFDASFFNHILPAIFLRNFRQRIPCADSMDVTPTGLIQHGQAYYETPRKTGVRFIRNLKNSMTRSIYSQASYLFPYSEFTKQSLISDYGLPEERILVLPPGTDLKYWTRRNAHSSKPGPFRILFVGSEFHRKGGDILLNVARREEFRKWEFHFVTRSDVDAPSSNVFVHKNLDARSDELLELYRHADVFVLPTRADFGPTNSVCEAMAMGLPVISTNVGGLDEIVKDGETGYVVDVNNEGAIIDRLQHLASSHERRSRIGTNARNLVEQRFNVEKNARRIVDYLKLAADRRNPIGLHKQAENPGIH